MTHEQGLWAGECSCCVCGDYLSQPCLADIAHHPPPTLATIIRRRASVAASNFSYDPHLLVPDDKQPVSLSYLDFLDALGRVALLAFAQPPYR